MSPLSFCKCALLLFLIKQSISYGDIITLTDTNFGDYIPFNKTNDKKWFILFYVLPCDYCKQIWKTIHYELINTTEGNKYNFGIVNCNKNIFTSSRFNISRLPYMITIEDKKIYKFPHYAVRENILGFLEQDKNYEDGIPLPPPITTYGLLSNFLYIASEQLQALTQKIVYNLGFDITLSRIHSFIMLLSCLFLFGFAETIILKHVFIRCCKGKIKKRKMVYSGGGDLPLLDDNKKEEEPNTNYRRRNYKKPKLKEDIELKKEEEKNIIEEDKKKIEEEKINNEDKKMIEEEKTTTEEKIIEEKKENDGTEPEKEELNNCLKLEEENKKEMEIENSITSKEKTEEEADKPSKKKSKKKRKNKTE